MSASKRKFKAGLRGLELTNEHIRKSAKGLAIILEERLPRGVGFPFQKRRHELVTTLIPVETEHNRIVGLYAKRDKKGQLIQSPDTPGGIVMKSLAAAQKCKEECDALWQEKQRVNIEKIPRDEIPDRVEGKPLVFPGVVWEFLEPILTD